MTFVRRYRKPWETWVDSYEVDREIAGVTAGQVWAVVRRPEFALTYQPLAVKAYVEPDTGPGLGAVHVVVLHDKGLERLSRSRVEKVEEPRVFVTRCLNGHKHMSRCRIEDVPGGVRVTVTEGYELRGARRVTRDGTVEAAINEVLDALERQLTHA